MSNIDYNFAKNNNMNILATIDRCMNMIPKELIDSNIIYIELDKENYSGIKEEVENLIKIDGGITLTDERRADIGKALVVSMSGYKIVIALNENKPKGEDFYLAFKTRIL